MKASFSAYPLVKLAAVTRIQPGYPFQSERFTSDPQDCHLVKGENVQQGYIDWAAAKRWPNSEVGDYSSFILRPGDVVVAMDRPWVQAGLKWAYLRNEDPPALLVQRVARLQAKPGLDQTYLRALISSAYFSAHVQPIVTGVNVPHISGKQIGDFLIPLPDLTTQRKIAAILSAYDDLIANNQRRIALLEGMAEEIYREWFVRMRFPGCAGEVFAKGVPQSWTSGPLGSNCNVVKGKSYAADELTDDESAMPFVTLKSFNRGGGYRADGLKHYSGEYKVDQVVSRGDIVMAVTDMTQDRVVVGQAARVPFLGERGAVISLDVVKIVPTQAASLFLYCFLRFSGFANYIKEFANGANVLHLKPDLIGRQIVVMPPTALQEQFARVIDPMVCEAETLAESCEKLASVRAALLPRLISGKLKVDHLDIRLPPSMRAEAEAVA